MAEPTQSTSSSSELIRAKDITKVFEATVALDGVTFDARSGEVHALVGENGAGKSTLLRILCGLEEPTSGWIHVGGRVFDRLSPGLARELGLALLPQHLELVESLSVADNVFLGRWPTRRALIRSTRILAETERVLGRLGLEIDPRTPMEDLTYVQKQMVEIARVTELFSPRLIVLDEPTAALSLAEIDILFRVISQLRASGVGFVYVSHSLGELSQIADRVTVLRDGRVVASAPLADLTHEQIVRHMVGNIPALYARSRGTVGEVVLSVTNCRTDVVDDLSFEVRRGEIFGIAAPKGEGISQFLRTLCGVSGLLRGGHVRVKGRAAHLRDGSDALRMGIGYLSEDRHKWGLLPRMLVRENVTVSSLRRYFGRAGLLSLPRERAAAQRMLTEFSIRAPGIEVPVESLSGGNQQKVLLARVLSAGFDLLVVDDPTFGVDVRSKAEIHGLINRAVEEGAGVIMYSSDLVELLELSDRLLLVKNGRGRREFQHGQLMLDELKGLLVASGGEAAA